MIISDALHKHTCPPLPPPHRARSVALATQASYNPLCPILGPKMRNNQLHCRITRRPLQMETVEIVKLHREFLHSSATTFSVLRLIDGSTRRWNIITCIASRSTFSQFSLRKHLYIWRTVSGNHFHFLREKQNFLGLLSSPSSIFCKYSSHILGYSEFSLS